MSARPLALSTFAQTVVCSLYRHRLLTTSQVAALHGHDHERRWTQRRLARLEDRGLVARVDGRPPGRESRWFLTGRGAEVIEESGEVHPRPYRMDAGKATAARHLLCVNDVGVALTEGARRHGDGFDWRSWDHEIPHPYGPGDSEVVIADAVLTYDELEDGRPVGVEPRLLELDRGTESVHELVDKLRSYARVHGYRPRKRKGTGHLPSMWWRRQYQRWPEVLIVFADMEWEQFARRAESLSRLAGSDPHLVNADHLTATVTSLAELVAKGPLEPIFRRVLTLEETPLYWPGGDQP